MATAAGKGITFVSDRKLLHDDFLSPIAAHSLLTAFCQVSTIFRQEGPITKPSPNLKPNLSNH